MDKKKIIEYNHHGTNVKVQEHLKGKHRDHCLCWQNCKHFKAKEPEKNCEIARLLYAACIAFNIVTPVWECPNYVYEYDPEQTNLRESNPQCLHKR